MKTYHPIVDLAELPAVTFGRRATSWWGTVGFMVIEAATLAVCAVVYLYLRKNYHEWPPAPVPLPDLVMPTIGVIFLVLSNIPNRMLHQKTRQLDRRGVQVGLLVLAIVASIAAGIRVFDFRDLNVHWDTNAYASAAWLSVALHSTLLLLQVVETWVFVVLLWFGPVEGKHFSDVEDTCVYWYFMSLVWVPIYFLVFLSPRLL